MKNFSSWLIAMFAFMFWGLRLVGTVMTSLGESFMFEPTDLTMEVVLLFITFIRICFIIFTIVLYLFYYKEKIISKYNLFSSPLILLWAKFLYTFYEYY